MHKVLSVASAFVVLLVGVVMLEKDDLLVVVFLEFVQLLLLLGDELSYSKIISIVRLIIVVISRARRELILFQICCFKITVLTIAAL